MCFTGVLQVNHITGVLPECCKGVLELRFFLPAVQPGPMLQEELLCAREPVTTTVTRSVTI
jgi:hypothetical protein